MNNKAEWCAFYKPNNVKGCPTKYISYNNFGDYIYVKYSIK